MHTENKIGSQGDKTQEDKFNESGFGRSLQGEQVWPPKKYVLVVRQVTQAEMDELEASSDVSQSVAEHLKHNNMNLEDTASKAKDKLISLTKEAELALDNKFICELHFRPINKENLNDTFILSRQTLMVK